MHARPHDLWLHARDDAGAHVVVPLERGEACPSELLCDAATLAAHFSQARGQARVDVTYVERRYVRKPRKSRPRARSSSNARRSFDCGSSRIAWRGCSRPSAPAQSFEGGTAADACASAAVQ